MNNVIAATTRCREAGHPEFQVRASQAIPSPDLDWLVRFLEDTVKCGDKYVPQQTVQIGWMITLVRSREDQTLGLWEPDMQRVPIAWVDSVTTTLRHLRLQKDVAESLGLGERILFPTVQQSAIVARGFESGSSVIMERTEPTPSDSGWFIGSAEHGVDHNDPANLRRVSLYEVGCGRPDVVMFLALPPGTRVLLHKRSACVWLDGRTLSTQPGSFLDTLYPIRTARE